MQIKDLYSIVVTEKRVECRDFYVRWFGFQVADSRGEFERLSRAGLAIAYPLHDEPWGQRRFAVYDPSGTWVDVIEQIDPAPGFWDKYLSQ